MVQLILSKFVNRHIGLPQLHTFFDLGYHSLISNFLAYSSPLGRPNYACDVCVVSFQVHSRQVYFNTFPRIAIDVITRLRMEIEVVLSVFLGLSRRASFCL